MSEFPIPFRPSAAGCGASARRLTGAFRSCSSEVVAAGTRKDRRTLWLAFACADHRECVIDPHPLTDDERAELDHRREQERRALAGMRFERPQPLPR